MSSSKVILGHTVYLASRKESAGTEAVAKIKKEKNLDVKFVQLEITDIKSVEAAVATVQKAEGRLDVLVNNAGISEMSVQQTALTPHLPSIRSAVETNLFGLIQTTTAFLPLLRASSTPAAPAVILNVSTDMASNTLMAGPNGFLHEAVAYNTSKAAANSYTIALAHELKAEGIKVNAVTPGFTTTRLNGFAPGGKTPEQGAQDARGVGVAGQGWEDWAVRERRGRVPVVVSLHCIIISVYVSHKV
ncbi:hypothetical protein B0H14DRAFT_3433418 [Mycena olivaceomarginata]|nr:hypothetical protein B0H14DRAFT_3433418 [Mycena olivaceomarginata]